MCRSLGTWNGYFYDWEGGHEEVPVDSMMTFVLVPGEGEHDFKANAMSLKGRQTISGSWSKGEDDVMQIKFKYQTSFSSTLWLPIFFDGRFDPERGALTGVWSFAEPETFMGIAEFRRIQTRYLTVYPSIKELRDNKPRALWKFAISAVRTDIRRGHWTWSYFSQRRDDRNVVVSLLVRSRWFGPPLSEEENETLTRIIWRLTPDDACFYDSMVDHIRVYTCVHQ
jgi:Vacuolar sorting-associated protein 13, N-terminal